MLEPEVGKVYRDPVTRRVLTVTELEQADVLGRQVRGEVLVPNGGEQTVPYSTSIPVFRQVWTEVVA